MTVLLKLDEPSTWPDSLLQFLNRYHQLFLDWEEAPTEGMGRLYDEAIYGLRRVLNQFALIGWHCTRLTEPEILRITTEGLQLPNADLLARRIEEVAVTDSLPAGVVQRLKRENQAHESNRAGMLWFCFFRPGKAGERGIGRFFRHWGGEALYNSHEEDEETSPVLQSLGTPTIVEATVPIVALTKHSFLENKVVMNYLVHRGWHTEEYLDHEDRIVRPLAAEAVRRIIKFPDPEFKALTGCDRWDIRVAGRAAHG